MSLIEKLKRESNSIVATSEELFGVEAPPEHQCPAIDSIIKNYNYGMKEIDNAQKYDESDSIIDCVKDAEYYLGGLEYEIEEVREAIDKVRTWGQRWKEEFKWLIDQLPEEQVREIYGFTK